MEYVLDALSRLTFSRGVHRLPQTGVCVMECVAYVAGRPHSDMPPCACPVAARIAAYVNDSKLSELGEQLAHRVLALANSRVDTEHTRARAYYVADQVLRVALPTALEPHFPELASAFRALPVLDHEATLESVYRLCSGLDDIKSSSLFDAKLAKQVFAATATLRKGWFGPAAYEAMFVLRYARAEVDLLKLLDDVLAISARPPLESTPAVEQRVTQLLAWQTSRRPAA